MACRTAAGPTSSCSATTSCLRTRTAGRRSGDGSQAGKLSIFDSQNFIADAAVYLKATQPDLNITNPYELDEDQFNAVVDLLKKQRARSASTGTASRTQTR